MIEGNTLIAERNINCNKVVKHLGLTVVEENDDDDYAYVRDNCGLKHITRHIVLITSRYVDVWKFLNYKMHHDVDMEDSASMQRWSIIETLQLMLIVMS